MSELIDAKTRKELKEVLKHLKNPVRIVFFTQEHACTACREQENLLKELAALSGRITLERRDLLADAELARSYGIDKVPGTAVIGGKDYGIRFYGMTMGYEFGSLVEALVLASSGKSGLPAEIEHLLSLIDVPVHLEVMVTLTCPYCPKMVHLAHQMAVSSEYIRADMVESSQFAPLVQRYSVGGVPKTVINEGSASFEGALPAPQAVLEILKAVKPKAYEEIDVQMREAAGERFAHPASEETTYDVLIVGAGPAALSAAVYASRKNLDVALIGESFGGQITSTADIENWLGIPGMSGGELTAQFRAHAERYPIAEHLGVKVSSVTKGENLFTVRTESGQAYTAKTVIFSAGKEYRTLGVPGESRFLGRGIAFCATCDAPLFRDRNVAVIGGGNSAFTAARDLLSYAREIHIVNILKEFQADPALMDEVTRSKTVTLHGGMRVVEFLGTEKLAGVRLVAADESDRLDLNVDGAFLEIGLVPNSAAVSELVRLNGEGEIEVGRDQSTSVPGLFAAGDVTDEPEKQIVVAAGTGAKAALAAYNYLLDNKLIVLH
ncbi:MAG TPA: FAD-dependent oxidoreductase [Deltaproteobacteria bacterium]|nr:FAD-dependent oxidoreductase [Deltaproteobacteria bacterium]HPR54122.1 FAD-dependent oxidoreductase [Deltaproteobacteria bacterium]HXK47070.1 FAD-dependent oxidoreductase [Deltaproteobacteria bacterium]